MSEATPSNPINHAAGFRWNILGQVIGQGALLIGSILLSRALGPSDFGLFAMVSVIGNLIGIIVSVGVTHAIVQQQTLNQSQLSTLFWINVTLGIIFSVTFFLGAPLLASFYNQPQLATISQWYSCIPLLASLVNVPAGILTRQLNYKSQAVAIIIAVIISYAVSYYSVSQGAGVLAFVIQAALYQGLLAVINFSWSRWVPSITVDITSIQSVGKFSLPLLGSQVIDFFFSNLDVLLAGKFLGKKELGVYGRANALVMLPANNAGQLLSKSFFPIFASHQHEPAVLQDYYLRAIKVLAMLVLPALILLSFVAQDFILFLLGNDWLESAQLIVVLSALGLFSSISMFNDSFIISQGKSKLLFVINAVDKSILLLSLVIGLQYGITGIAIAKVIAVMVAALPRLYFALKLTQFAFINFIQRFTFILVALVGMIISEVFITHMIVALPLFIRLILGTIPALIVYGLILYTFRESALKDLKKLFHFRKNE